MAKKREEVADEIREAISEAPEQQDIPSTREPVPYDELMKQIGEGFKQSAKTEA